MCPNCYAPSWRCTCASDASLAVGVVGGTAIVVGAIAGLEWLQNKVDPDGSKTTAVIWFIVTLVLLSQNNWIAEGIGLFMTVLGLFGLGLWAHRTYLRCRLYGVRLYYLRQRCGPWRPWRRRRA